MSDKPGTSVPNTQSASKDKEADNVRLQEEYYERFQAEMSMPSTSGMTYSSEVGRKRPRKIRKMEVDDEIKTDKAAKFDETGAPKNSQGTTEHPKRADLSGPLSLSFSTELTSDLEEVEKTSTPIPSGSGGIKHKRSHLLIGQPIDQDSLEVNDDGEERQVSEHEEEKETECQESESVHDEHERALIQQIEQMSVEELSERVFSCMRLCAENKINVKNAFNLHLIDWLPYLLKQDTSFSENFSTLACTIDASAKIYSHRVDIVYKEALKLAEMLSPGGRNKKNKTGDGTKSGDDQSSKKKKTTIVSSRAVLLRKRNVKNPLRKFVKVGARAGDLMNAMLKTGKTFSSNAPYKPKCKRVPSKGKVVSLKLKSHRRLSRCDYHSFKKIHGRRLCKSRKARKTASAFGDCEYLDPDLDQQCHADDSSIASLMVDFEGHAPEPQGNVLDVVCQKVEASKLLDRPEQFTQLSRVEKLSLVLNNEEDSFVNKDLEMLLYGPLRLRNLQRGGSRGRRIVARRGRKKFTVDSLDFNADPDANSEKPGTSQQKQITVKEKPKKQRFKRTQFMIRTISNWCEDKQLVPEKIIVNLKYLNQLALRDDIDVSLKTNTDHEYPLARGDGNIDNFIDPLYDDNSNNDSVNDTDGNWDYLKLQDVGHTEEINEEGNSKENDVEETEENQDFQEVEGERENLEHEMEVCLSPDSPAYQSMSEDDDSSDAENLEGPIKESVCSAEHKDDKPSSDSSMCSLVEAPVVVKVQELKYSTRSSRVNMKRLKGAIKDILDEGPLGNKENAGEGTSRQQWSNEFGHQWSEEFEGAVALPPRENQSPVMFADVLSELPARLDANSAEDLTPQMAFLALLHVATENQLMLRNDETSDIVISRMTERDNQLDNQIPDESDSDHQSDENQENDDNQEIDDDESDSDHDDEK